jgi:hypothetical protein
MTTPNRYTYVTATLEPETLPNRYTYMTPTLEPDTLPNWYKSKQYTHATTTQKPPNHTSPVAQQPGEQELSI